MSRYLRALSVALSVMLLAGCLPPPHHHHGGHGHNGPAGMKPAAPAPQPR
ncbi:hypothetical protein Q0Q83_22420 [Escherichia marmotae]